MAFAFQISRHSGIGTLEKSADRCGAHVVCAVSAVCLARHAQKSRAHAKNCRLAGGPRAAEEKEAKSQGIGAWQEIITIVVLLTIVIVVVRIAIVTIITVMVC